MEINKITEADNRDGIEVGEIDEKSEKDLHDFVEYYNKASDEEKQSLDKKYNQYFNEELQKDSELENRLSDFEINESAEISPEDIANLNTVRSLRNVLDEYPNINDIEYKALERMVDYYIDVLGRNVAETLNNLGLENNSVLENEA